LTLPFHDRIRASLRARPALTMALYDIATFRNKIVLGGYCGVMLVWAFFVDWVFGAPYARCVRVCDCVIVCVTCS
jgi:hypothetical protein